jgi:NADH:ubiquinone oxidoreductase subunit 6 (subunit J)
MTLLALTKTQEAGGHIALAMALGVVGFFLLLPRPSGRSVAGGTTALITSVVVLGTWVFTTFGNPLPDLIGTVLFWLFSAGALIFGTVLVAQRNPARGAIAFAFVILSTCGLFLLLAAPFLMAATIIIYAGAIIVTFLFVLMLSRAEGPSDENDRTREPLYGSFAGFAFLGLVLFTLYQTSQANAPAEPGRVKSVSRLPAPVLTADEQKLLDDALPKLEEAEKVLAGDLGNAKAREARLREFEDAFKPAKLDLAEVVGTSGQEESGRSREGSVRERLEKEPARFGRDAVPYRADPQARDALQRAARVREAARSVSKTAETVLMPDKPDPAGPNIAAIKAELHKLRDEVVLLHGTGELPANNVRSLGFVLYSEHLLAIELAGTLLLVAVIGAIAVAHRKGVAK